MQNISFLTMEGGWANARGYFRLRVLLPIDLTVKSFLSSPALLQAASTGSVHGNVT